MQEAASTVEDVRCDDFLLWSFTPRFRREKASFLFHELGDDVYTCLYSVDSSFIEFSRFFPPFFGGVLTIFFGTCLLNDNLVQFLQNEI